MTLLNAATVEDARDRGGAPAEDRPDRVAKVLEDRETLGYGEGEPLAAERYSDYPDRPEDLSNPKYYPFCEALMSHPLVGSYSDCVEELTTATDRASINRWEKALEDAAGAYGLDAPTLFSKGEERRKEEPEDRLTELIGFEPPNPSVENGLLVATLYADLGLSCEEIADLCEDHAEGSVRVAAVEDTLRRQGLLEGATREEQADTFEAKDGKLGGTSFSFDREALAEAEGVTYQRGEK